jgi:hypothetical protein
VDRGWEPLTVSRHVVAVQMKEGTGRVPKFASGIAMRGSTSWEDCKALVSLSSAVLQRGEGTLYHGLFVCMKCDVLYCWPQEGTTP